MAVLQKQKATANIQYKIPSNCNSEVYKVK